MLKSDPFRSRRIWETSRESLCFQDVSQYEDYKHKRLSLFEHDIENTSSSFKLPKVVKNVNSKIMERSGTTSQTKNRLYLFSKPEYRWIENHHIWKIEKFWNISEQKPFAAWYQATTMLPKTDKGGPSLYGPHSFLAAGSAKVLVFYYNQYTSPDKWVASFLELAKMSRRNQLRYIKISPSVFQTLAFHLQKPIRLNCPLLFTEETLSSDVLQVAKDFTNDVIDKMLCWDGTLGFFLCPHGKRHLYDELSHVEVEHGESYLLTSDYYNRSMRFLRYKTGDLGRLETVRCNCGLAGQTLEPFLGKDVERLWNGKTYIPGRFVGEMISSFLLRNRKSYNRPAYPFGSNFVYRIHQKSDGNIQFFFHTNRELHPRHKDALAEHLHISLQLKNSFCIQVVQQDAEAFFNKSMDARKSLSVKSDYVA